MLSDDILNGDIRAAARLMRDIDDEIPSAREEIKRLFPHTGNAHIVGITGSPGAGKSTLANRIIQALREREQTVGVVAIDPTSPISGGAIMGDRVRMQRHSTDDGVFIRSLATRGHLGGVSRSTHDIIAIMDSMGKDVIIVETVGAGQDEVEIVQLVHTSIVVIAPGMGDGIQAIKAGILEIGNIFVINKADKKEANMTAHEIEMVIAINTYSQKAWKPPVIKTDSLHNIGITELLIEIDNHGKFMTKTHLESHRQKQTEGIFLNILRDRLSQEAKERLQKINKWDEILESLKQRQIDPYSAAEDIIKDVFKTANLVE